MSNPKIKLISFTICPYVQRAVIVLNEKNIPFDVEYIDLAAPPPWFYDVSPLEKVPVLLIDDKPLFESMVICDYLDDITPSSLYPDDAFDKALNRSWLEFGNEILTSTFKLLHENDAKKFNHLKETIIDHFEILEEEFSNGNYFNGDDFAMIDAVYAPIFRYHQRIASYKDYNFFEDSPNVKAWGDRLLERPSVINSIPESHEEDITKYFKNLDSIISQEVNK
ncbi:MAG: glutathione S-transferase family protein [Woeseiaceae bacterium]